VVIKGGVLVEQDKAGGWKVWPITASLD